MQKLLPIVLKRLAARRDKAREQIEKRDLYTARARYRQSAELAAAVVTFDRATQGQYRAKTTGVWKELVVCLGNAAEMSNRLQDHKLGLGFAISARDAGRNAPASEEITVETVAKNERRIETARTNVGVMVMMKFQLTHD